MKTERNLFECFDGLVSSGSGGAECLAGALAFDPAEKGFVAENLFPIWVAWLVERQDDPKEFAGELRKGLDLLGTSDPCLWRFFGSSPDIGLRAFVEGGRSGADIWDRMAWTFADWDVGSAGPVARKTFHLAALVDEVSSRPSGTDHLNDSGLGRWMAQVFGGALFGSGLEPVLQAAVRECEGRPGRSVVDSFLWHLAEMAWDSGDAVCRVQAGFARKALPDFDRRMDVLSAGTDSRSSIPSIKVGLGMLKWIASAGGNPSEPLSRRCSELFVQLGSESVLKEDEFRWRCLMENVGAAMKVSFEKIEEPLFCSWMVEPGRFVPLNFVGLSSLALDAKRGTFHPLWSAEAAAVEEALESAFSPFNDLPFVEEKHLRLALEAGRSLASEFSILSEMQLPAVNSAARRSRRSAP